MFIRDALTAINLLLALGAVPPSLILMLKMIQERNLVESDQRGLNNALTTVFGGISFGSVFNAFLALKSLTGDGYLVHTIAPGRTLYINAFFLVISWSIYLVYKNSIKDC